MSDRVDVAFSEGAEAGDPLKESDFSVVEGEFSVIGERGTPGVYLKSECAEVGTMTGPSSVELDR